MVHFPDEILEQISEPLCVDDLISLRFVSKRWAAVAARFLFTELCFSGCERGSRPGRKHTGRIRYAEYGGMEKAVADVLPFARHVRKFRFEPAYYIPGMWKIAGPAIQKSEWDLERTTGQKRKRNDMGLLNEMTWLQMMEDQTNNEKCVAEALAKLLEEMKLLRRIEIFPPQISDKLFEGAGSLDRMTKNSGYQTSKASIFRKDVGEALLRAKRNVTELHIRPFKVDAKRSPPGLVHMMGQLQDLDIELTDQGFLLENKPISPLRDMLRASQHSLRSLRMAFSGLPDRGVHCITKVLFEDDGNTPMSFPNLETFSIPDIILRSQPVADFISAQPRLRRLETRNVRLASPGFKWMDAVAVFPKTMKEWFIDAVGHDPDLDCPKPIAYNHVELWLADEDADLARAGWQKDPEEQTRWGLYTRH